jgi:hypothetical protein
VGWRRKIEEYEADLYPVPEPSFFLLRLFRTPKGELELKTYEDGERRLEVELHGVGVPDGSVVSVVIDGQETCQVRIDRGRGRLERNTGRGEMVPQVKTGSVGEIRHNNEPILRGEFEPD